MNKISQEAQNRKRMLSYYEKHGGTAAAIRYKVSRKTLYKWLKRYDGRMESLEDRSHRPNSHPNQHTEEEIAKIRRYVRRNGREDIIYLYQRMIENGYERSYGGFKRVLKKIFEPPEKKVRRKKRPRPYQRAKYPGEKVQIDVKYVPIECSPTRKQYYVFIAVDECSRIVYREMYDERSTYSAKDFIVKLIKQSKFPIRLVQTDNGTEFTNSLLVIKSKHKTLFEEALDNMDIQYQRIRVATPRHNGKVERQNRIDGERFYKKLELNNLEEGRYKLSKYNIKSNDIIKTCLEMHSPSQVLEKYLGIM